MRTAATESIEADGPDALWRACLARDQWTDRVAVIGGAAATTAVASALMASGRLDDVVMVHVGSARADSWADLLGASSDPAERWQRRQEAPSSVASLRVEDTTRALAMIGALWCAGAGRSLAGLRAGRSVREAARFARDAFDALRLLPRPEAIVVERDAEVEEVAGNLWVAGTVPSFGPGLPLAVESRQVWMVRELAAPTNLRSIRSLLGPGSWKGASTPFDEVIMDFEGAWELDGWVVPETVGRRMRITGGPTLHMVG